MVAYPPTMVPDCVACTALLPISLKTANKGFAIDFEKGTMAVSGEAGSSDFHTISEVATTQAVLIFGRLSARPAVISFMILSSRGVLCRSRTLECAQKDSIIAMSSASFVSLANKGWRD